MWMSVMFPTCPECRNNSNKCYHKNCSKDGEEPMEINSDTAKVRCPSCGLSWNIKESNYYCSCGHTFSADEVSVELDVIVANARLIADEMKRNAETWERIESLTNREIEIKTEKTIKRTGGEKIWKMIKDFLPTIVEVVKHWLIK